MLEPFPRNICVGKLFATSKRLGGTCRGHEVTYDANAMQVIRAFLQRTSCVSPDDETVCKIAIVPHVAPKKDAKRGWHFRKRRFWCRNDAPRWLASKVLPSWVFGGGGGSTARSQKHADTDKKRAPLEGLEICEWHEEGKQLYTYTRNISLRKMIVCEELAVIKECPEDASKCVKACEVRIRVAFRGPWLFGLHKIAERWVAKRYERLVKETSRMEVNRIESLKKMEEYVKEMLAGTKSPPSLEKIEKFVSACERTNHSTTASSLDSSVNMSLSPDGAVKTRVASSATKKKEKEIELIEKREDERGEKYQRQARSETPRSSTTTEYMEPCSFGDEDFVYQADAASSLREGEEEQEEEERRVVVHREDRDKENPTSRPSRNTTTKTPENQAKQPLRVLFHSKNFKVEVE